MQILIVVLHGEPRLENYFNRIISHTADLPDPAQVEFQYDGRGFEDGVKVRADLAFQMTDLAKIKLSISLLLNQPLVI